MEGKIIKGNEIRKAFLEFFKSKGHEVVPSSSLVPHNDPTLLFTNAGMVQFKDTFLELEERPYKRATTAQKCVRAGGKHNDLDTVGKTARHHTFFEMMGNFSFGDYFKEGAIGYAWEFLTEVLKLDKEHLYITIYNDDDEAFELWQKVAGVSPDRIFRLGEKDNFWAMGDTGPCGPCSEIHYDRGEEFACGPNCGIGKCDCDRWLEIWNLVFMQFNRDEEGNMTPLPHPCIDTGMGLERVASILQNVPSNYDTDLLQNLIQFIEKETGLPYYKDERGFPMRVVADHARSCTFLIADGVLPSNDGRGYVLRRILRRAARFIKLLGIDGVFLAKVVPVVVDMMGDQYPEIREKKDFIIKVIANEEERFHMTLADGMKILEDKIETLKADGKTVIPGDDVFQLYDTYGFPIDLTEDAAEENGMTVDKEGFEAAMEEQRRRARNARSNEGFNELEIALTALLPDAEATEFTGYTTLTDEGHVEALIAEDERKAALGEGDEGYLILDKTPCYAEMGGQVGDRGTFSVGENKADILTTFKLPSGVYIHKIKVTSGQIAEGDNGIATVNEVLRKATQRNHTATHLMHKALKEVLGDHANQAGSLVNEDRLRFDFNHFSAVTPEELKAIEDKVNAHILENINVCTKEMDIDEAKAQGAMALFGEKYGKRVRFVDIGGWSKELCGGTHVHDIGEIGLFKIVSESSIGAGLRRIEAVTGDAARAYFEAEENELQEIQHLLKVKKSDVLGKIQQLLAELKEKDKEIAAYKEAEAASKAGDVLKEAEDYPKGKAIVASMGDMDMNALRETADKLKENRDDLALVLFATGGDKVSIVISGGKDWVSNGFHAGKLIKEVASVVGGGGGGKPNMAQAGGKDTAKVDEAMKKAKELLKTV
ncbi:MAG: alanine--tRNA ligase [Clostridia bacterium]